MPAPKVTVENPVTQEIQPYYDFTGNTAAIESVDIRARVTGFLQEIHFGDGDMVNKGDVLFTIEPDIFEAHVAQAKAMLAANEAELELAEADLKRVEMAVKTGAVSEQEVDIKRAERNVAKATVAKALASLDQAKLDLSYTQVISPITGRISRSFIDSGNLVGPGENSLLTRVVRLDKMYVYSNISERLLIDILKKYGENAEERRTEIPKLYISLAGEDEFSHEGEVDFVDNTLDPQTGTVQVRGVVPNTNDLLFPGMFVRMRIPSRRQINAILVKEIAIGTDLGGKYVLVVDNTNMVHRRYIEPGQLYGDLRVVKASEDSDKGIKPNEQYIVRGQQRARPGRPVTPKTDDTAVTEEPAQDNKN
ncbi:MAG: efflux RND transporter periplasmic adaptor subunit [Planctomycetota bacterium]|jgi:RND family efflux transporter MFP subunit